MIALGYGICRAMALGLPTNMKEYYARRAPEYERIYARPERQADLNELCAVIERTFSGRTVLDVACGTGFFSVHAARHARFVTGVDANPETLAIARAKNVGNAGASGGIW